MRRFIEAKKVKIKPHKWAVYTHGVGRYMGYGSPNLVSTFPTKRMAEAYYREMSEMYGWQRTENVFKGNILADAVSAVTSINCYCQ